MLMKNFEKNIIEEKIASFGGLSSIGDGNNDKIEQYFHSFMDWLDFNNVLDVINRYAGINMNLQYVTSHDFLIWLLHYGDIYDNVLEKYFPMILLMIISILFVSLHTYDQFIPNTLLPLL
jgi:hypothetical protein